MTAAARRNRRLCKQSWTSDDCCCRS